MAPITSTIRTDLLSQDALDVDRTIVEYVYDQYIESARASIAQEHPLKSIGPAKELDECFALIKDAIDNSDERAGVTSDAKIRKFSFEEPSEPGELEAITILPTARLPGQLSKGRPSKGGGAIREIVAHIREEGPDPDDHNYRIAVLGKMYDNWVDFTCWARTNKAAFSRALWFSNLIEEYTWYFTMSGVNRIIVEGHKERRVKNIGDNIFYGYPVECFIRTEKITRVSEKTLEQLIIKIGLATS